MLYSVGNTAVVLATTVIALSSVVSSRSVNTAPTVTVKNGTYVGRHNAAYAQDLFLGMPFAQPPVGDLRFRAPVSLNSSFHGVKNATVYPPECVGYGSDNIPYVNSEDCLYINVVRPSGLAPETSLPVLFWIYGGNNEEGGSGDIRYNLTFLVDRGVQMGKPILAVSSNYRVSAWGFLGGKEALAGGATNAGFRDQRLALHWVRENIKAFGGDPDKVTIVGESAGAEGVGAQLLAYRGRDDKLFRAAISESGGPAIVAPLAVGSLNSSSQQATYNTLVTNTSCASTFGTSRSLECLRKLPFAELNAALNISSSGLTPFTPQIDNDFYATYPSDQLNNGEFVKVPYICGSNTNEGTLFSTIVSYNGSAIINTDAEFERAIQQVSNLSTNATRTLAKYYPNDPSIGIPSLAQYPGSIDSFGLGSQLRRVGSYAGDWIIIAPRRATNVAWAAHGVTTYSYRFDVTPGGLSARYGPAHFQEVAFVFDNTDGLGYASNPFGSGLDNSTIAAYKDLAKLMSSSWVSFVHDLDPNQNGIHGALNWPKYATQNPQHIVWAANGTYIEYDNFRAEGMKYMAQIAKSEYGR
ncbi:hypothetical protein BP5796_02887 [Coleophoma crateriformis]|uniref:Carboxylic ester hydrolase n=1 Tax=Coleophoma crateriformis TaxID=565419 RepID=A0A3D8SZI0_9HELO|nr:hypothetical protein BP5796_02887 [Coleophoma crateriformis]